MSPEDAALTSEEIQAKYPQGSPGYPTHHKGCGCSGCYASWTEWRGAHALHATVNELKVENRRFKEALEKLRSVVELPSGHGREWILEFINNNLNTKGKVCRPGVQHVRPCGPTDHDMVCACGCEADDVFCCAEAMLHPEPSKEELQTAYYVATIKDLEAKIVELTNNRDGIQAYSKELEARLKEKEHGKKQGSDTQG